MTRHLIAFIILPLLAAGPAWASDGKPQSGDTQAAAPASSTSVDRSPSASTSDIVPARLIASETVVVVAAVPVVQAAVVPTRKGFRTRVANAFWLFVAARVASE